MEDLQPVVTKEMLITKIFTKEDLIEESIPKLALIIPKVPEAWLDSIDKNFETFLSYCLCVTDKYNKEIKPLEIKTWYKKTKGGEKTPLFNLVVS